MIALHSLLASLLTVAAVVAAPQRPSVDPFYRPASDFASKAAGAVLNVRLIQPAYLGLQTWTTTAYQILYKTRMINGTAIATVTTLYVPNNRKPGKFVSFQIAEDAAFVDCAPSYGLQQGADNVNPILGGNGLYLQGYLSQGYAIATVDYEGPDAAFASRLQGYAVLDGMRAVNAYLGGNQQIVGVGYSGGAIATGWAASFHNGYAPELNVKGWTIGGTPANLTATLLFQENTVSSGFAPIALSGLNKPSSYFGILNDRLQQILTQLGKDKVNFAGTVCVAEALASYGFKTILDTAFNTLGRAFLDDGYIKLVLNACNLGYYASERPIAPVFLYHALNDEVIPYAPAAKLAYDWCSQGAKVQFNTYAIGEHLIVELSAMQAQMSYVNRFFNGQTINACANSTIVF